MSQPSPDRHAHPEVVVLYCRNCLASEPRTRTDNPSGPATRLVMVPCTGKVEVAHLVKIFEQGAQAILVAGCPPSNCRLLTGSLVAEKRVEYLKRLLQQLGLTEKKLSMVRQGGLSEPELVSLARQLASDPGAPAANSEPPDPPAALRPGPDQPAQGK